MSSTLLRKRKMMTNNGSGEAADLALCFRPKIIAVFLHLLLVEQRLNRHTPFTHSYVPFTHSDVPFVFHYICPGLSCRSPEFPLGGTRFALLAAHLLSQAECAAFVAQLFDV